MGAHVDPENMFRVALEFVKNPYAFLKKRNRQKEAEKRRLQAKKKRQQINRESRTSTIKCLQEVCEFGKKTIAELRAQSNNLRERVRHQETLILDQAVRISQLEQSIRENNRQKVVLGMEKRELESQLEIANEKIEGVKTFLEIYRE